MHAEDGKQSLLLSSGASVIHLHAFWQRLSFREKTEKDLPGNKVGEYVQAGCAFNEAALLRKKSFCCCFLLNAILIFNFTPLKIWRTPPLSAHLSDRVASTITSTELSCGPCGVHRSLWPDAERRGWRKQKMCSYI